jgi:hypothetical protein
MIVGVLNVLGSVAPEPDRQAPESFLDPLDSCGHLNHGSSTEAVVGLPTYPSRWPPYHTSPLWLAGDSQPRRRPGDSSTIRSADRFPGVLLVQAVPRFAVLCWPVRVAYR